MGTAEDLRGLVEPVLASAGLTLWDVVVTRDVVRVLVERDGGVDLDVLSAASDAVSPLLETHDELVPSGQYQLEISSPGLERTLRTPEQYRRYVGTTVSVKTTEPVEGERRHRGTLLDAGEEGVSLSVEGADAPRSLRYPQIDRTVTVVDWDAALRKGGPRSDQKDAIR